MKELIKYVKSHKIFYCKSVKQMVTPEVQDVLNKFKLTLQELCYRLKSDIPLDKVFTCQTCGKPVTYSPKHKYAKFCCKSCSGKYTGGLIERRLKATETIKRLYGSSNYRNTEEYDRKARATHEANKRKHYEEVKDQLEKFGLSIEEYDHRIRHNIPLDLVFTCERCGKKIEYNKKRHSYSRFCGHKCANRTITQSDSFKEKTIHSWNERKTKEYEAAKEILKQYKLTLDEYKYRIKNGIPLDKVFLCKECGKPIKFTKKHKYTTFCCGSCSSKNKETNQKKYDTMKVNGTCGTSEPEEKTAILLSEKFPDTKRQFRSKEYPFNCDFYIPSLNLYIEFNGHWTHGLEPYDPNNPEHIKILNFWKSKNTDFYRSAIHTWTIRDPLKVKTAKENNLNFKVFWTLEEVQEWLKII